MSRFKKYLMDGLLSKGGSTMTEIKISKSIMIIIREGVHELHNRYLKTFLTQHITCTSFEEIYWSWSQSPDKKNVFLLNLINYWHSVK